jgi:hypothetical protein
MPLHGEQAKAHHSIARRSPFGLCFSPWGHCALLVKVWTLPNAAIRQSKDNRGQPVWLSRLFTDKSDCVFNLGERPATK